MYQTRLACQRQCSVSQFNIVEQDEVSQVDVLRMYRLTMSATTDGRVIKVPHFSAPMVRCSTSTSSHATGGTTSTAQRHRRSTGIHTFPSSVNYGLLFILSFFSFLFSFCTLLSFPLLFLYFSPLTSPVLLFTSFSLSIIFLILFAFNIYYYYHHHYPILHFVSIFNPFILLLILFLPPSCLFFSSYSVCSFPSYSTSTFFFYFLSFSIFFFFFFV